ncbi:MAG TPA: ABC transporter substrate-binding protein [Verrucomicrobiota bacterium]|nr:hypothetical protein [Verrucomicrobiales bacterium]HRI12312.1 ABC transporter substrate-binding protein [Verrucomicrobiota bacterium]
MKSKPILLIVVVAVVALGLWWKNSRPITTGGGAATTLRVGLETEITTLDPAKTLDPHVSRVVGQIFEGLVGLNENNEVVPLLAESWESNTAGDIWTFKIRAGVPFHESGLFAPQKSREVTADDVVFTFNRIFSKDSQISFVLDGVIKGTAEAKKGEPLAGVKALSPNSVQVELQSPDPLFVNRLTSVLLAIVPREVGALPSGEFGVKKTVGTGPFRVDSVTQSEATLSRNPAYWRKTSGNVQKLAFRVIKNEQLRLQELKNGQVDLVRVPASLADGVVAGSTANGAVQLKPEWQSFHYSLVRTFNVIFLGFNCPKLDLDFRRAVTLGINRAEIATLAPGGLIEPAMGPVPLGLSGYKPPFAKDIMDVDAAKAALATSTAAAKKDGFDILVHEKDSAEQVGQLLQSQLAKIGIQARLTKLDYNTVIQRMISGEFDSFIMSFEYIYGTPGPIVSMLFSPQNIPVPNFTRYNNPKVNALLDGYKSAKGVETANDLAQKIEQEVVADPPATFLFQNKMLLVYPPKLSGVKVNGHSVPLLWEASLAPNP